MTRDRSPLGAPAPESPADPGEVDPTLFEGFADDDRAGDDEIEAMLRDTEGAIERERGPMAWLRARSTAARLGLGLGISTGLVLATGLLAPRGDLDMVPRWRLVVTIAALAALLGASVWYGLRPLHRPPVPRWFERGIVLAAVVGTALLALLPLAGPTTPGPSDWAHALPCLYGGLLIGLPAFALIRLLDRGGRPMAGFLAAAAAGLGANAALALHCSNDGVLHLMSGHVAVVVAFVLGFALWRWSMSRLVQPRTGPRAVG